MESSSARHTVRVWYWTQYTFWSRHWRMSWLYSYVTHQCINKHNPPPKHTFVTIVTKVFTLFHWFSCDKFIWRNSHSITWNINGTVINQTIADGALLCHTHHSHSTRIRTAGNNLANHISLNITFQDILLGYFSGSQRLLRGSQGIRDKFPEDFWIIFCNRYFESY